MSAIKVNIYVIIIIHCFNTAVATNSILISPTTGSHCLVQWDEPGKPYSVVENKYVKGFGEESVSVGDMCSVGFRRGVKMTFYDETS